jgi:hypothetical protein
VNFLIFAWIACSFWVARLLLGLVIDKGRVTLGDVLGVFLVTLSGPIGLFAYFMLSDDFVIWRRK